MEDVDRKKAGYSYLQSRIYEKKFWENTPELMEKSKAIDTALQRQIYTVTDAVNDYYTKVTCKIMLAEKDDINKAFK